MPPLYAILVNDTSPFLSVHTGPTNHSVSLSINQSNDQVSQPINHHSLDGFLRVPHYIGEVRIFQRGWVTVCQREGTHQIVMSTSTPCF